jgi:hypothetical protein
MAVNFKSMLDKPTTEAKRPPVLPAGTYYGTLVKWEPGESAQKKTPYIRFHAQLTGAGEDIDAEQMAEIDLSKKQMRMDFYMTPDAEFRIQEFMKSIGIVGVGEGRPYGEMLPECIGKDVIVNVTQQMNQQDPTQPPFNNVQNMKGKSEE